MIELRMLVLVLVATSGLLTAPALAHHSYAMFDMEKSLTLEGTVTEIRWTNPHIMIRVEVVDAGTGEKKEWSIEGNSPNMLRRRGWTRNALNTGDTVVAIVNPVKAGDQPYFASLSALTVNGRRVFTRQAGDVGEEGK